MQTSGHSVRFVPVWGSVGLWPAPQLGRSVLARSYEIIFSLKHYWRFVDCEALELKALSREAGENAASTQAEFMERKSQRSAMRGVKNAMIPSAIQTFSGLLE
jgi:hypothetical protein